MGPAPRTDVFSSLASCPASPQESNPNRRLAHALVVRDFLRGLAAHLSFEELPVGQAAEARIRDNSMAAQFMVDLAYIGSRRTWRRRS